MTNRVEENVNLVHFIINRYYHTRDNRVEYDDMFQEGLIGLYRASKSFNDTKGKKFSNYAISCIHNEIRKYLRKELKRKKPKSLDAPIQRNETKEDNTFHDVIGIEVNTPENEIMAKDIYNTVINGKLMKNRRIDIQLREKEYFRYMIKGYKQQEIIRKLNITQRAGTNHARYIRKRLQKDWINI